MPVLSNSRHELFAQEVAKGASASAAFVAAGYARNDGNASRLNGNEKVRARIEELKVEGAAKAAEVIGITQEMILRELSKIGFSDIRKVVRWSSNVTEVGEDPDTGEPTIRAFNSVALIDSSQIDDATAAALAEVSQTKEGALKIKLYDKRAALVDMGRHLGMFVDKSESTVTVVNDVTGEPQSPDEWAAEFVTEH